MSGLLPKKPGAKNNALYTDSTLAIEPKTGKVKWYRQHLETDTWDLDYVYERMLIDLPVNGVTRKALVTTGKLGIIEAIDRTNGEWLWHKETIPQNVVASIDPKTGEKTINQASVPHIGQTTVNCPADPGGRGWPATAYNPNTGTLYLPLNEYCSNTTPTPARSRPGLYRRRPRHLRADAGPQQRRQCRPRRRHQAGGPLDGLDRTEPARRRRAQCFRPPAASCSAAAWDRLFRAYDDATGKVLWETKLNNALNSFPVTYSVNGKQYVAVVAGNGSSHARSLATLTPEIRNPDGGSVLWVFALPELAGASMRTGAGRSGGGSATDRAPVS